ncbi:MAG: ABC transporter permease [Firmicutes bacterium]|nr:ABC transporter permease [Bacillota bacterium]
MTRGNTADHTNMANNMRSFIGKKHIERESLLRNTWRRLLRNKMAVVGLILIIVLTLLAIFAGTVSPYDPYQQSFREKLQPPNAAHLLGTDELGRDMLSRLIYGARISLSVGLISQFIAVIIGIIVGAVAGYFGGRVDNYLMRLTDMMFAFPDLLFAMGIMFALGPGLINLFIALGIVGWAGMARLVRGQVLSLREREFIEAARAIGESDFRIIMRHVLPNCMAPIIISVTLGIPGAIMAEAGLSFLGLGAQPPLSSWGQMIAFGKAWMRSAPWLSIYPGLAIMITVLAFNLFGDGLRDALDPRLKD